MSLEGWLLFIHITAGMVWLGGGVLLAVTGFRARRSGDTSQLTAFGSTIQYVGTRVLGPAMWVLLLAGIALVIVQSRSFTETWILVALAGFVIALLIGALFIARTAIELGRIVAGPSPDAERVRALVGRWLAGYGTIVLIVLVIVWDMVFKPGA